MDDDLERVVAGGISPEQGCVVTHLFYGSGRSKSMGMVARSGS